MITGDVGSSLAEASVKGKGSTGDGSGRRVGGGHGGGCCVIAPALHWDWEKRGCKKARFSPGYGRRGLISGVMQVMHKVGWTLLATAGRALTNLAPT
ncbi:hypothetical protein THAOC_16450 [Thalassiosira oceanica]|uniref:Uncharacterized protein n=1 Tax=Thalassiosira oceanica TaxID=159749 RepID=K0SPH3_THAOC|nr:hypothetical protein THAOC_16450 [Thalassiosira oceanica]|eukprot:EJK62921.1 hypothetical protein THAOC_16450 [Thalassiosira oceanica]